MNLARPLLISADTELIDECTRLAAAAGTDLQISSSLTVDRTRWAQASLVLIDMASTPGVEHFPRRRSVIVLAYGSDGSVDSNAWRVAVEIGAEHVACLPDADTWLIEQLGACGDEPARAGRLIACLPASGGAGSSTLAAACAVHSASQGETSVLIDGDRLGGGLDIVLGGEDAVGVRWPELVDTHGRLAPAAFRQALPTMSGVAVLSWDREGSPDATVESWTSVLDASMRGFDLCVVDLPREFSAASATVLSRAHAVVLVVTARVRGAIAAARCLEELTALTPDVRVIVREKPNGVRPEAIAHILGVPVLGTIPMGHAFIDDGRLPRIPEVVLRACTEPGLGFRTSLVA